jgi:hypothetical protein
VGQYYYLVPQLPYLVFGQAPPMSPQAFRELAMPLLDADDAVLLDLLGQDLKPPFGSAAEVSSGSDFIDKYREWERILRQNLAKYRSGKLKREAPPSDPPVLPSDAVSAAAKAVQESPLEGEIIIDKARWHAIDTLLEGSGAFDRNVIFAYMLKLIILNRQALFQTEKGFSEYKSLYASILEQSGKLSAGESK